MTKVRGFLEGEFCEKTGKTLMVVETDPEVLPVGEIVIETI